MIFADKLPIIFDKLTEKWRKWGKKWRKWQRKRGKTVETRRFQGINKDVTKNKETKGKTSEKGFAL